MHYHGGKGRLGKRLHKVINHYRMPGQEYLEPFCGALGVLRWVPGKRTACDLNPYLINMFKAMQAGWLPPSTMTKAERTEVLRIMDVDDPLTAYAAIIYSHSGDWCGSFNDDHDRILYQFRGLKQKMDACKDVTFLYCDYRDLDPHGMLIYCDPPYAGTMPYAAVPPFDNVEFWDVVRKWSKDNTVLVSEITAPDDFKKVAEYKHVMHLGRKIPTWTDKLYTLNDAPLFEWPLFTGSC